MLCGQCEHLWVVSLDWIDRWEQAQEECPSCGVTCEQETAPRVTVDENDPALNHRMVSRLAWYHTSTHPDWPAEDFDPTVVLTPHTRRMMGGDARVARWAERQRSKALHIGTYEAAIHNMFRRMHNQADHSSQFYLYRVYLRPTIAVRKDWLIDPSNFVGDVVLNEVCPPGNDVARYLNYHEDPGGISLALGRESIIGTQQLAIPHASNNHRDWVSDAVTELQNAVDTPEPSSKLSRFRSFRASTPQETKAREIAADFSQRLPINLRSQFQAATAFRNDSYEDWARHFRALADLIQDPDAVISELNKQPLQTTGSHLVHQM